jgi:hypothetical protein
MGYLTGKVSRDYFVEVAKNHIVVLYFAATTRQQFQSRILGVPFWQKAEKLRHNQYKGEYHALSDIFVGRGGGESRITS